MESTRIIEKMKDYKNIIRGNFFSIGSVVAFIWNNDATWSVATVSKNIKSIFGYEDTLFLQNILFYSSLIHPEDLARVFEEVKEASVKKLDSFNHKPYRILHANGKYLWVKDSTNILYDEAQNITHFVGYIISIDDEIRKNMELTTQLSFESAKLKALVHALPDLVWLKDKEGAYLFCNKRFEEFFGAKECEIVGKTDYDFVDKTLADFFRENDLKAMESNIPMSNFEEIPFASDGHKEYLKTTKSQVLNQQNELIGVLGVGRDFTKEKEAQRKLEEQKRELQTIFDTTKDGIAVLDLETNFKKVNKAYCEITGLSEEEILATSCFLLTYPDDIPDTLERMKVLFEKGFVDSYEKRCLINGRIITVSISVTLFPDGKHMLLSMKDISKMKHFEAHDKLATMGEMIGNIAHQWRQPLSVITATASGIAVKQEFGLLDEITLTQSMESIMFQANYLSKTIDDFRNFIKDSNETQIFSIKETLTKTFMIIKPALMENHITLITDLSDDMEIEGYENQLIQAFINIINNAKDAIKENVDNDDNKLIFVETKKSHNKLEILIKDSGGGIPEDVITRIFEPYFTTKHQSIGTGIGLSMAHKIFSEQHNATIEVENQWYEYNGKRYKGACFRIVFEEKSQE